MRHLYLVNERFWLLADKTSSPFWDSPQSAHASQESYLFPLRDEQLQLTRLTLTERQLNKTSLLSTRQAIMQAADKERTVLIQALQLLHFYTDHRFCGRCGGPVIAHNRQLAGTCQDCQFTVYPRLSPCMIVAVRRGQQILLAQGPRHADSGIFAILAGFVEVGESLEDCVHREVMEEVGIKVKNLEYFDSQSWPFPHAMMVGFLAEYDSGEICVDGEEILQADWFELDNMPKLPPPMSIAYRLIEATKTRIQQQC